MLKFFLVEIMVICPPLLTGLAKQGSQDGDQVVAAITNPATDKRPPVQAGMPDEMRDIMCACWNRFADRPFNPAHEKKRPEGNDPTPCQH